MDETYETYETYEPVEPIRPKPSDPPPLKRLWKSPDEPETAVEVSPSTKKKKRPGNEAISEPQADKPKKKKKKEDEVIDDGTGATKLEETPVLDTYEARQRARWIIGGVLGLIMVIFGTILYNSFKGSATEVVVDTEPTDNRAAAEARASLEREARIILDMAKTSDRLGKSSAALEQLNKLTKVYGTTAAGREAMVAIDRYKHEKSLFGADAPQQPNGPKAPPPGISVATGPAPPKNPPASESSPGVVKVADNPAVALPPAMPPPAPKPIVSKKIPAGYRPNFDFPIHDSGWPTRLICDRDGADLVLVPAATFLMGRADGEPAEKPTHEVFVSTYYIDLHEVTIGQYLRFLKETGRPIDIAKLNQSNPQAIDDEPVVNVSNFQAKAYCDWAKRRLPTEAQWELAARGPQGLISYWNGELPRKDPDKGNRPMERVMTLSSDISPYGVFDLGANAWEWTSEYYDSKYYLRFRNLVTDPTGPKEPPSTPAKATVKGGSKLGFLTWREGQKLENKLPYLGFRGALPVEGAPVAPAAPPAPNPMNAPMGGGIPF